MKQSDFATAALAKAYFLDSYVTISAGMSSQFFGVTGMLDALESNIANTTMVQLAPTLPQTSVGALCRTVLTSARTTGFACDPTTEDGQLNRAGAAILVVQGIFTQPLVDAFFAKGFVRTFPFINTTDHSLELAKGTVNRVSITVEQGYARITTNAACELHNPQITQLITFADGSTKYKRVSSFVGVESARDYIVQCPTLPNLFVDNTYGVIS